jgi:hypothetical protein
MTALSVVRAGYGAVQLAVPGLLAGRLLGQPPDPRARMVARVLGARQLAQAGLSGPAPTAAALALGVEVDALHAASMIGLAVLSRRWRPAALASAAVAAGFATAGVLATRRAWRQPAERAAGGGVARLGDRCADGLARHLVPGYPRAPEAP